MALGMAMVYGFCYGLLQWLRGRGYGLGAMPLVYGYDYGYGLGLRFRGYSLGATA